MSDDQVSDTAVREGLLAFQHADEEPGATLEDKIYATLKASRPAIVNDHNERLVAEATKGLVEQTIAKEREHSDRWESEAKAANRIAEEFRDLVNQERARARQERERAAYAETTIAAILGACDEAEAETLGDAAVTTETIRAICGGEDEEE